MKKKNIGLTALVLSASLALQAQSTQVVRWVNTTGGNSTVTMTRVEDIAKGIVEDGQSNTYVIGNYTGSISFQEYGTTTNGLHTGSPTTKNYTSQGGSQDIFLARYDIDGYCTWSASIGGAGFDEGNAICMSNPSSPADFYITGTFNQSMTIGTNTLYVVASGYAVNDAFIIRYNTTMTTTPTPSWWDSFGGSTETCGMGIVTNGTNVFVTGYYTEFCMDANTDMVLQKTHNDGTAGTTFSTSTPGYLEFPYHDMFLLRYSNTGVYGAALHTYGSEDEVEGHGVALSGSDVYVTGTYKNSIRLTSSATALTCSGHSDIFLARYPQSFTSSTAATTAATAGGPSTTYQAAPEQPFYKQDEGYGIYATNYGIFITGRFMDQATFGAAGTFDPSGAGNETYMYLARYDAALTATPVVVTGSGGYSEGRGIFGINGSFSTGYVSTIFVTGGAVSTASVNGTQVESNGYTAENVGFIMRIAYSNTSSSFPSNTNNFVDGIAQNQGGLNGTGLNDINVVGYAISYRVGCGVRTAGRFSSKTAFGNLEKTASGVNDAYLAVRENAVSVTSSTFNCGSGSVTLTGTGGTSPLWTGPSLSSATYTVAVTPSATTTYTFSSTSGSCPASTTPVTVFNFPAASAADAGPNKSICGATHTAIIGTPAMAGATYSWTPSGSLSNATIAQPTATVSSSTTYTMTVTDKCGNVSSDVVTVFYNATCPRRLMSPEAAAAQENTAITVSPNPANGLFTITTANENAKDIFIYDMTGKLVFSQSQVTGTTMYVDITDQPAGIYLVRVVNGDAVETQNIIKQ